MSVTRLGQRGLANQLVEGLVHLQINGYVHTRGKSPNCYRASTKKLQGPKGTSTNGTTRCSLCELQRLTLRISPLWFEIRCKPDISSVKRVMWHFILKVTHITEYVKVLHQIRLDTAIITIMTDTVNEAGSVSGQNNTAKVSLGLFTEFLSIIALIRSLICSVSWYSVWIDLHLISLMTLSTFRQIIFRGVFCPVSAQHDHTMMKCRVHQTELLNTRTCSREFSVLH